MFNQARLKLTAWYLVIIMFVSLLFSLIIYRGLVGEVERFARNQRSREFTILISSRPTPSFTPPPFLDDTLIKETKERIIFVLMILNGGILVISGVLGYFLAGRTLRPIKDMMDEQNRFISDSSHELRTPLTSLKSSIEVAIRDKKLTLKDAKNLISENLEDVNRLQTLTDRLLVLSSNSRVNSEKSVISLKKVIDQAVKNTEKIALKKKIKIKNNFTGTLSVYGNYDELSELFTILVDNAIKYSNNNSSVEISAKKGKKTISVSVKDHGMGIAEKDLKHIFDRFYRSDSARSHEGAGGFGLGLSIAQKIVEYHGGTINVDSKVEKGTVFTVCLPLHNSVSLQ